MTVLGLAGLVSFKVGDLISIKEWAGHELCHSKFDGLICIVLVIFDVEKVKQRLFAARVELSCRALVVPLDILGFRAMQVGRGAHA